MTLAPKPLADLLSFRCFDYQRDSLLSLTYQIESAACFHPTTSLCLALFLSETPSFTEFTITALALFITRGKHYYIVLENDASRSVLDFEHNTNLTLRSLIKDESLYVKLVDKVVEINRGVEEAGGSWQEINVLMLDKVNKHQQVLTEMVRLQRVEIERKVPDYFVLTDQGREKYMLHLSEPRKQITLITKDQAALLNNYEKQGYKKLYPD